MEVQFVAQHGEGLFDLYLGHGINFGDVTLGKVVDGGVPSPFVR